MTTKIIEISNDKALQGGIYSIKEAAFYTKVPTKTLKKWYLGDARTNRVLINDELIENGKFLNFLDFVQTLAIRELRIHHNIPLQKIREAIKHAQEVHGINYPFAKEHKTFYDGNGILIELKNGDLIRLTKPDIDQYTMKPIMEYYLRELKFNEEGYAKQYRPEAGILLDPKLRFGEPILERHGITALTIYESVLAEGNLETVSDLYEIEIKDVEIAYKYIDTLKAA